MHDAMGIELYWLKTEPREQPLIVIDDALLNFMAAAVDLLEKKSGVYVDPYGTTPIAPAHAAILVNGLEDAETREASALVRILNQAVKEDRWLVAEGD
jgi:hypothetical protein